MDRVVDHGQKKWHPRNHGGNRSRFYLDVRVLEEDSLMFLIADDIFVFAVR